jgi:hypothetical protein
MIQINIWFTLMLQKTILGKSSQSPQEKIIFLPGFMEKKTQKA